MLDLILSSLYFFLPAYFANMCPVLFAKVKLPFAKPINEKLFGSHKTWRGFYTAYFGALLIIFIQFLLQKYEIFTQFNLLNYEEICLFLYAFLFGIGAVTGDVIKSFFKRKVNIKPGKPWIPFDQLDFVAGALIFLLPVYILPWQNILTIIIATPILHFLANLIGYLLGLKKVWW